MTTTRDIIKAGGRTLEQTGRMWMEMPAAFAEGVRSILDAPAWWPAAALANCAALVYALSVGWWRLYLPLAIIALILLAVLAVVASTVTVEEATERERAWWSTPPASPASVSVFDSWDRVEAGDGWTNANRAWAARRDYVNGKVSVDELEDQLDLAAGLREPTPCLECRHNWETVIGGLSPMDLCTECGESRAHVSALRTNEQLADDEVARIKDDLARTLRATAAVPPAILGPPSQMREFHIHTNTRQDRPKDAQKAFKSIGFTPSRVEDQKALIEHYKLALTGR